MQRHWSLYLKVQNYLILCVFVLKDMFLCDLLQAVHSGLLELHQTFTCTGVLHLNLALTLLCRRKNIYNILYLYIHCVNFSYLEGADIAHKMR